MEATLHSYANAFWRRDVSSNDSNVGSATTTTSSLSALLSTLIPVAVEAGLFTLMFLILRRSHRRFYAPRTYLGTLRPQERSPDLPNGMFNWFTRFFALPDSYVLNHQGIDGYLFLRFLKIASVVCLVGCCLTWPILFPINATGGAGQKQLDLLSMSNVIDKNRYYAHTFVAWVFFGFVMYMITRESIFYISLRQAYLLSPMYAHRISSRTVLFVSVPNDYLDEGKLRQMFGSKLKNLWIATDCKDVEDLVKQRDKVAMKLEGAEIKLIKAANTARLKDAKKRGGHRDEEALRNGSTATNGNVEGESGSAAAQWISPKKRPTHRLKPIIGKKVDTIDWCRAELQTLIPKVDACQAEHRAGDSKFIPAVFVEFISQSAAQDAYQRVAHHQPLHMTPRYIGMSPEEIVWKNLRIRWWERVVRYIVCLSFVVALIIFWSIPVGFVGIVSNINYIISKLPWLAWLEKIPSQIFGVITGLLPSVMLSVLMALLPIILRLMAKQGGDPTLSAVEYTVQNWYFWFQFIQAFLVTTITSAATSAVVQIINNPGSLLNLLATQLPKASNFYISYFIVQGMSIASGTLFQMVGFILFNILGKILDKTPRKMYKRWATLSGIGWGTLFPVYTNMLVIAITYSCIAPLILGFATIGLYLLYLAYRYNFLFVYNASIDTKGLVYPRALQHTFTGMYLAELCMIGLFAIQGGGPAIGPLVLMVIFLVFTILYHVSLNGALDPLLYYLPQSLEVEEEALLAMEDGVGRTPLEPKGNHPAAGGTVVSTPPPHKQPNFLVKWLAPFKYQDYHTLRRLIPRDFVPTEYDPEIERNAYYHPAIASSTPTLWVPRDDAGVSRQEVWHTSKVIPITDQGARLNEKGKIVWDEGSIQELPVYEEKIYY